MRRVIDDMMYKKLSDNIMYFLDRMDTKTVSVYRNGMDRMSVPKVREYIVDCFKRLEVPVKFGKTEHAYGIGNNNAIEIIWCGEEKEEQICGLLHLNTDMFGGMYCHCSDIDEENTTEVLHYRA